MGRTKEYYHDCFEVLPAFKEHIRTVLKSTFHPIKYNDLQSRVEQIIIHEDSDTWEIIKDSHLTSYEIMDETFRQALDELIEQNKIMDTSMESIYFFMTLKQRWRMHCELVE
jgi:hypothetical protein